MAREYKDSGIEWIGQIPKEWDMAAIKRLMCLYAGATPKSDDVELWNGNIPWITPADYKTEDVFVSQGRRSISEKGLHSCATTILPVNSIVFSKRAPIGLVVLNSVPLCTNQGCIGCVPKDNATLSKYYYYVLSAFTEQFELYGAGTTFKEISATNFSNFIVCIPPLSTQQKIADYLDKVCGEVDEMVALQETMIEELKAYKQSVITEAVTKGLNPSAPMRNSGIDWIGEIPEHWGMQKMNRICSIITDFVASGSFESLRLNVPYLDEPDYAMLVRTADLSGSARSSGKVYISKDSYDFLRNSNLYGGEIVLPNIGASVGDVYIVPHLYEHMSLAPNSIMFKTVYCDKYYYYYYFSKAGKESIFDINKSTAQGKFNKTELRNVVVCVPPISEQQQIATYLETKCSKIDSLIALKQAKIEELKEYKKSIIYEYVTGKKEVC